jgi:hypothetical protein
MGCWNEIDGITNIPVRHGEKVRVMLIKKQKNTKWHHLRVFAFFTPVTFLVDGKYDDYGGIENVSERHMELFKKCLEEHDVPTNIFEFTKNGIRMKSFESEEYFLWFTLQDTWKVILTIPMEWYNLKKSDYDTTTIGKWMADMTFLPKEKFMSDESFEFFRQSLEGCSLIHMNLEHQRELRELSILACALQETGRKLYLQKDGYQEWNYDAHVLLSQHVIDTMNKWKDYYGS